MSFEANLIALVRDNRELYDKEHYSNNKAKEHIWNSIADTLNCSVISCRGRWKSLRDRFVREHRNALESNTNIIWQYYDMMLFMQDHLVTRNKMSRPRSVADDSELSQYNKDSDVSSMSHQQKNEIVMADEDDASADMILDTLNNESYVTCLAEPNNRKRQQPQSHNGEINCPKIEQDATDDSASSLYGRETTPVRQPIRKKKRLEKSSVEENFATFLKDMTGVIANKSTQSTSTDAREEPSLFVQLLEEKMNQLPPNERMKMEISLLSQINTRLCVQNDPLDSQK